MVNERASAKTTASRRSSWSECALFPGSRFKNGLQQGAIDAAHEANRALCPNGGSSCRVFGGREAGKVPASGSVLLLFAPVASTVACEKVSDFVRVRNRWAAAFAD
jgi:hypothetical protein